MSKRVEMTFEKDGKFIKLNVSKELQGVLYANGEKGDEVVSWIAHRVSLKGKDGVYTGKDMLKEYDFKIPLSISANVKSIGERKTVLVRTGKYVKERIHSIVNGERIVQAETWEHLTDEQKEHLSRIDIWDVHDELVAIFSKGSWKPSWYIGALQQILNKVEPKEKLVPEIVKQELNSLTGADITLKVNNYVFHFTEGSYFECKNNIVRSFAFTLDRTKLIKTYLASLGYEFKWEVRK